MKRLEKSGDSYYYIDATVYESGIINILMYDMEFGRFYQMS